MFHIKVENLIEITHFSDVSKSDPLHNLRSLHRHRFKILTTMETTSEDVETESFELKSIIQLDLEKFKKENDNSNFSCKTLAIAVKEGIIKRFGDRIIKIEVFDGDESLLILHHLYIRSRYK